VEIDGIRYGSIDANMERRTGRNQWIELTLTEGKNREVRRVLEHLGLQVSRLIRIQYGPSRWPTFRAAWPMKSARSMSSASARR
jgi:pseudouridine synthase